MFEYMYSLVDFLSFLLFPLLKKLDRSMHIKPRKGNVCLFFFFAVCILVWAIVRADLFQVRHIPCILVSNLEMKLTPWKIERLRREV